MKALKGKTIIITGASRGIGRAIALKCAGDGANIVIAAKSAEPHPKLPGTIHSVAEEVKKAGGDALAIQVDVRSEESVVRMVQETVKRFGGIDVLINNAGAIQLTPTEATPMKRYDLMQSVNVRAVYLCSQQCLPYLKKSSQPHILNLSPPVSLDKKWLAGHVAYTLSKFGMSLCTLGMAEEFKADGISVNSLWPKTLIDTAAIEMILGDKGKLHCRKPEILADAAYYILSQPKGKLTGRWLLDEEVLAMAGIKDLTSYACAPGQKLLPDLYVD